MHRTFTSLRELKEIVNNLSDEQLDANTNLHDWYLFDLTEYKGDNSRLKGFWFSLEGREG